MFPVSVSLEASFTPLDMVLYMFSESVSDSRPVKRFCKINWKRAATSGCFSCSKSGFGVDLFLCGQEKLSLIFVPSCDGLIYRGHLMRNCSEHLVSLMFFLKG